LFFAKKTLHQNRLVCWSIVVKESPAAGSTFFGTFPSDRTPKAMKDVNVRFFIHTFTISLMQQFL
jgi:hypothetical protein